MGGVKHDQGKLRFDLLPVSPLRKLAHVYTMGAKKYSDRNWEKGFDYGRIFAAMQRHAWAYWGGERDDPEDGQHHLASVAWCAFALMEYEESGAGVDDRPLSPPKGEPGTKVPVEKGETPYEAMKRFALARTGIKEVPLDEE